MNSANLTRYASYRYTPSFYAQQFKIFCVQIEYVFFKIQSFLQSLNPLATILLFSI